MIYQNVALHPIWWHLELYILGYLYNINVFLIFFKGRIFEHWTGNNCVLVVHILTIMLKSVETYSEYWFDRNASLILLALSQIH